MFRQPHRENRLNRTGGDIGENAGIANALFGNLFRGLTFLRANTTRVVLCATDNPTLTTAENDDKRLSETL